MQPIPEPTPQQGIKLRDKLGLPGWGALLFIPVILLLLLALLIFVVLGGPITVDGSSMYPTLHSGDRAFVMKYRFGSKPKRGDIVRLKDPTGDPESIIKRVVAVGSDRVTFENDRIVVNGTQIHPNTVTRVQRPSTVIIPKNTLFVMGDN